jgi:hypothetical protein
LPLLLNQLLGPERTLYIESWQCKIWGSHCGDYEESCLLGCYAVWLL